MIVTAIVLFILIFSLVILAHELGHFYFAKRAGMRVEEFGIGLPPRIVGIKKGETIYSINWIPLGGFVRVYGENEEARGDKRSFASKGPGQRIMFIVGGVLMNFVLAAVVLMIGFWFSMPPLVTPAEYYVSDPSAVKSRVVVLNVTDDSPAELAGILRGDRILASGDVSFSVANDLKEFLADKANIPVNLTIDRSGQEINLMVTPTLVAEEEGAIIGTWIDQSVERVDYVWWKVPWLALQETVRLIGVIVVVIASFIYRLFATASLPPDLAGPVGIAKITADVMHLGWLRVLQFIVFLSINLGVINLVPFPALDGGRLAFVLVEIIRGGKKVSSRIEGVIHALGFALLILLILVVTYRDMFRFF